MKISNLQLKIQGESILLSADCLIRPFGADKMYFKLEKKYMDFIAFDMSPFAAALLIPSMKLGSPLIIDGEISEQMYKGLHEIMETMLSWNLGLKPINIQVSRLKKDSYKPNKHAMFFSGGVDSFYTYLKNKLTGKKKVSYFILANGFDVGLNNTKLWRSTVSTVQSVAENEGVEIIKIESNARVLTEPIISWGFNHGGCLAALGLVLRKKIKSAFVASTFYRDNIFLWGTHPDIDHLWGTETFSLYHHGTEATRLEKVRFISRYPIVLKNLRVCYLNKENKFNCGKCDKCLRTMIEMYIAGTLERSRTFPKTIDIEAVKHLHIEGKQSASYQIESLSALQKMQLNYPLQDALEESIKKMSLSQKAFAKKIVKKLWFIDHYYTRSNLYKIYKLTNRIRSI